MFLTLLSSTALADAPQPNWNYITTCFNVQTQKIVLTEKSINKISVQSPYSFTSDDDNTGDNVFTWTMGSDILCQIMDRETYNKRNK